MPVKQLEDKRIFLNHSPREERRQRERPEGRNIEARTRQVIEAYLFMDREIVLRVRNTNTGAVFNARLEYLIRMGEIGEREAEAIRHLFGRELEAGERPLTSTYRCAR